MQCFFFLFFEGLSLHNAGIWASKARNCLPRLSQARVHSLHHRPMQLHRLESEAPLDSGHFCKEIGRAQHGLTMIYLDSHRKLAQNRRCRLVSSLETDLSKASSWEMGFRAGRTPTSASEPAFQVPETTSRRIFGPKERRIQGSESRNSSWRTFGHHL